MITNHHPLDEIFPAMAVCAHCRQPIGRTGLYMAPIKRRILDAMRRHPNIAADALRSIVWADDPNGGPLDPKVLHVHINQLNKLLAPYGYEISAGRSRSGYRLRIRD